MERAGNLVVVFDCDESDTLQRHGNNLVHLKKILLSEALSDLEFKFKHPSGKSIIIHDENVIKPGQVKVIKGLGFPSKKTGKCGDFLIKFNIKFPEFLDEQKKELIHKLLPKRSKLKASDKKQYEEYCLENYDQSLEQNDSDDESDNPGVQCAQQ